MRKIKYLSKGIVVFFLLVVLMSISSFADYSGNVGDITWTVEEDSGRLTVSGSGSIPSYENGKAPWYPYASMVKEIEVVHGVDTISLGAFYGMDYVETLSVPFVGESASSTNSFIGFIFGAVDYYSNNVYLPSTLKTVTVTNSTAIAARAFNYCDSIEKIVLGDTVKTIGDYAFAYCHSLKSLVLGSGTSSIGNYAFNNCSNLKNVFYNSTSSAWSSVTVASTNSITPIYLKSSTLTVTAPAKTEYALGEAFDVTGITASFGGKDVTKDVEITYPDMTTVGTKTYTVTYGIAKATGSVTVSATADSGVTGALTWSFDASTGTLTVSGDGRMDNYTLEILAPWYKYRDVITSVAVLSGVESIGDYGFYGLTALQTVTLSSDVALVGYAAFEGCSSLATLNLTNSDAVVYGTAFRGCDALVYTDGTNEYYKVTGNNYYMLKKAESLSSFKEGTVVIGENAFEGATFTTVNVPDHVKVIGDGAFKNSSVKTVALGTGVSRVGNSAFENSALTDISFAVAPAYVGVNAFKGADSLNTTSSGNVKYIGSSANPYMILLGVDSDITECTVNPSTVTIASLAFANCKKLVSVVLPEGLKYIGDSAFYGDSALYSVKLPRSVKSIGALAFSNCTSLAIFEIGNQVESIGNGAFRGASALQSIAIPLSVKNLGYNAFRNCTSLVTVGISDGVKSIGYKSFEGCTSLENVYLPDSLYTIGDYAFMGAESLKSVAVPYTTTQIGFSAFANTGLVNASLPFAGARVGSDYSFIGYIFGALTANDNTDTVPSTLKTVVIGSAIADKAFYGLELNTLIFDTTVTSVSLDAFPSATVTNYYYLGTAEEWAEISTISVTPLNKAFTVTPPSSTSYEAGQMVDMDGFIASIGSLDVLPLIRLNSNPIIAVGNEIEIPVYLGSLSTAFVTTVTDDITITSFSLLLEGSIGVKAYISLTPYAALNIEDIDVSVTFKGETYDVALVSTTEGDETIYYVKFNVAAKEMNEDITFDIKSSSSSETATVSVKNYVDFVNRNKEDFADTIDLVNAMYDYGEYSRKYFSETEIEIKPSTDASAIDVSITSVHKPVKSGSVTGLTIYSSSLLLESETAMRHYFKLAEGASIDDYTFTLENGAILTPCEKDGYWYVDISNIPSHRLNKLRLLTVTKGDETAKFLFSPFAYIKSVVERNLASQTDLINTLKALYNYYIESSEYYDFVNGINVTPEENESEDQIW